MTSGVAAGRAGVAVAAVVAVVTLVPHPAAWRDAVRAAGDVPRVDDLAVLLTGAVLWALAVWVLGVVVLAALASLPGPCGRVARLLVRVTVPRVLRGIVLGGLAGGLVIGPAVAANAVPVWPTVPAVAASSTATPGPAWPTGAPASASPPPITTASPTPTPPPTSTASPTSKPSPTSTASPTATPPAAGTPGPGWPTDPPGDPTVAPTDAPPGHPAPATSPTPTSAAAGAGQVVVAPGDSLWSITASALATVSGTPPTDRQVAAAWPTWFAVNRAVVGPDPGLLIPGTYLTAPPTTAPPTTDGSTP